MDVQGADLGGDPFKTSVQVELQPIEVAVNSWQLQWAAMLATLLKQALQAKRECTASAAALAGSEKDRACMSSTQRTQHGQEEAGGQAVGANPASAGTDTHNGGHQQASAGGPAARLSLRSPSKPATKALGVFGRVWDYVVNEAEYVERLQGEAGAQQLVAWGCEGVVILVSSLSWLGCGPPGPGERGMPCCQQHAPVPII